VLRVRVLGFLIGLASLAACTFSDGGSGVPLGFSTSYAPSDDAGPVRVLHSVRGTGAGTGWAVGDMGLALVLSGNNWTEVPSGSTATLGGLSALDSSHAYAVELGGDRVLAWNGHWAPLGDDRAGRAAAATFAAATNDVWVVGDGIEHWDGTQWTQQVPPGTTFTSIAGSFSNDVWAVGPTTVQHYDGKAWTTKNIPAGTPALAAVWATSQFDVWIAGAEGTLLRSGGGSLARITSGTTTDLTCVGGGDPTDIWFGGKDGTLSWLNGAAFTPLGTPSGTTVHDLWKPQNGDLMLVDDTGTVVRYVR
jgi:hypothetical protein